MAGLITVQKEATDSRTEPQGNPQSGVSDKGDISELEIKAWHASDNLSEKAPSKRSPNHSPSGFCYPFQAQLEELFLASRACTHQRGLGISWGCIPQYHTLHKKGFVGKNGTIKKCKQTKKVETKFHKDWHRFKKQWTEDHACQNGYHQ